MAGAVFGDVGVLLFVAGAVFCEIWIDSRSAKCCNFQYKMRLRSVKSNLGERADRSRIGIDASAVFGEFFSYFGV